MKGARCPSDGRRPIPPPQTAIRRRSQFELPGTARLSSAQIRAARALLRWSAADLAKEAALGANTIRRAEVAEEGTSLTAANELAVRRALEAAGVEFIDENGGGPGVRLRKPTRQKR
jgi:ribosome-binding protein aMBF1 (putative translation factor)